MVSISGANRISFREETVTADTNEVKRDDEAMHPLTSSSSASSSLAEQLVCLYRWTGLPPSLFRVDGKRDDAAYRDVRLALYDMPLPQGTLFVHGHRDDTVSDAPPATAARTVGDAFALWAWAWNILDAYWQYPDSVWFAARTVTPTLIEWSYTR